MELNEGGSAYVFAVLDVEQLRKQNYYKLVQSLNG